MIKFNDLSVSVDPGSENTWARICGDAFKNSAETICFTSTLSFRRASALHVANRCGRVCGSVTERKSLGESERKRQVSVNRFG